MIACIFTIDYEVHGNGEGSLRDLVYEPAERLKEIFLRHGVPFVLFVEAAELEKIEELRSDDAIGDVLRQIKESHRQGIEIGLHLHPQWCNARYDDGRWLLDNGEYNLCSLPRERVRQIVTRSVVYLQRVLNEPGFTPLAFRAGNWLLQPTEAVASVLAEAGIKIDSSVFKGGLQRKYGMDYRPAQRNGYYWTFKNDVNKQDPDGALIEMPTYAVMVPFWKMLTAKRVGMQRKIPSSPQKGRFSGLHRLPDYLRLLYPLKFDFCRMTRDELTSMLDRVIDEDKKSPAVIRPLVAIGHTKDLFDFSVIDYFLSYLERRKIKVATFSEIYSTHQMGANKLPGLRLQG